MERADLFRSMAAALGQDRRAILAEAERELRLPSSVLEAELERCVMRLVRYASALAEPASGLGALLESTTTGACGALALRVPLGRVALAWSAAYPFPAFLPTDSMVSALAAGCHVVVVLRDRHPTTSRLELGALRRALGECGLPEDVVSFVDAREESVLLQDPGVYALVRTSARGASPETMPTIARAGTFSSYADVERASSVFVLPDALNAQAERLGAHVARRFRENLHHLVERPGLVTLVDGAGARELADELQSTLEVATATAAEVVRAPEDALGLRGSPLVLVHCADLAEMHAVADALIVDSLVSLHLTERDAAAPGARELEALLSQRASRLVVRLPEMRMAPPVATAFALGGRLERFLRTVWIERSSRTF